MIEALSRASFPMGELRATQGAPQVTTPSMDFGTVLKSMAGDAATTLRAGEEAAVAGITGSMPVQQVVEQVLAAERTLQTAIAIRDKMVSAYLEISRMQI